MVNQSPAVVLIILDGWGIAPPGPGNAITLANPTFFNQIQVVYPHTQLAASGEAVGLPRGEDGNSEVGHINLGAGQIIFQDLPRINMTIADGSFFQNQALLKAINHTKKHQSTLHLMGLIGSGGVHANNEHLYALIKLCQQQDIDKLSLHLFTDGRDSPPTTAKAYIDQVQKHLESAGIGQIASIIGRYYAMDRDFRWKRTEKAYRCLTEGIGQKATSAEQAIKQSYENQKTDEFIEPTNIVNEQGQPVNLIKDNDAVIFYNFRVDRPRQLTKAFILPNFEDTANTLYFDPLADKYNKSHLLEKVEKKAPFKRQIKLNNLCFTTMTEYQQDLPVNVVMPPLQVNHPVSRVISEHGLRQLHMAETEKERFVTYYFNGLREQPFPGEDWLIIPSPNVATYDLQPQMSTPELTQKLIEKIRTKTYQFILINYACPDMVAHTGSIDATKKAIEAIDESLAKLVPEVLATNSTVMITADHGNAEELINLQSGEVDTEHSTNPVPFILIDKQFYNKPQTLEKGVLADIAPTILKMLNIPKPPLMTGKSLI